MPPRIWFALDALFVKDPRVEAIGDVFGAGGPLALAHLMGIAKLLDDDGRFTVSYRAVARASWLKGAKQAREVVALASDKGLIAIVSMDREGFVGTFPNWRRWQVFDNKGLQIPSSTIRSRAARAGRKGDANGTLVGRERDADASTTDTETEKAKAFSSEVVGLCDLLADLIEQNGSKRPTVTTAWKESGRLLLERDGRDRGAAERVLRWCQADEFWRGNVLSMPTFRKRYDQLRLAMERSNVTPISAHQRLEDMRRRATEPEGGDAA